MRPVNLSGAPAGDAEQKAEWLHQALRKIERASNENDTVTLAQNFVITGTYTATRTLDISTAVLADLIAFVATLVSDMQKGGANRTT